MYLGPSLCRVSDVSLVSRASREGGVGRVGAGCEEFWDFLGIFKILVTRFRRVNMHALLLNSQVIGAV